MDKNGQINPDLRNHNFFLIFLSDSLIKRVVEKESRDRLSRNPKIPGGGNAVQQQRLQICDGIVRSKLQVFDETKRTNNRILNPNHQGFVKAKLAIFDAEAALASGGAQCLKITQNVAIQFLNFGIFPQFLSCYN